MNYRIIAYIIGWVLNVEAAFMLPPVLVGAIYGEKSLTSFLITIALCLLIGVPLVLHRPKKQHFYVREGFVTVALSWVIMSIMGSLPFLFSGSISHPVDALFETVSGFTTTGASVLSEVESLPKCILFWRSFTHWIGGMGVLIFLLSLLKLAGGSHMNLMKAESPGPSVTRLTPTVRSTAKTLYGIYIFMTIVEIIFLLAGGMPLFDALTTTFGTAGTGGFGIKNDSIASYSTYIQVVVTVFMILFGINFNIYFLILAKKWKQALKSEELKWYLITIGAAMFLIAWDIRMLYGSFGGGAAAVCLSGSIHYHHYRFCHDRF